MNNESTIEVFRTNVRTVAMANSLIHHLQLQFPGYRVNFDLDDCDRILRVQTFSGNIDASGIIAMIKVFGCSAEILPDEIHLPVNDRFPVRHKLPWDNKSLMVSIS